ncbi:hypothetical protein FHS74_001983 [Nitrospirillum iridis]|uniref:Uncharacterized protein n=1 Tax=Nitrospirillum iridis TaxID=765888 RepID=A0A7X0AXA1_9PROT|nr:hypothetical protein [Nitrospirillum iridis]
MAFDPSNDDYVQVRVRFPDGHRPHLWSGTEAECKELAAAIKTVQRHRLRLSIPEEDRTTVFGEPIHPGFYSGEEWDVELSYPPNHPNNPE